MAKNVSKKITEGSIVAIEEKALVQDKGFSFFQNSFWLQAGIIAVLAFIFYSNTISNNYALDDTIVIVQNEYVLEGFAGILDILTKDAYDSYYRQLNSSDQVPGGRYRPLSIVTFAIEQQFFGAIPKDKVDSVIHDGMSPEPKSPYELQFAHNMHIRHLFNVLWFTLSVIVLLYFLRTIVFRRQPLMAFIAAVVFTIHPIHAEVLANVKSRDEIMSLLFICLTFIFAFRYREQKKLLHLGVALLCCFLAFLSKEYAITLLALLPLSFYLFRGDSLKKSFVATVPYILIVVVYMVIRLQIANGMQPRSELADNDIQINPYALASGSEKIATEIATSLNYLKLLVVPYPLSADYSYNQIPYKDFSHPLVWLSLLVHLSLFGGLFYFFKKRSVLCFAIAFYLFNLLLVNNFIFDIGATMGERLIYHSSVGFAIALAYLLCRAVEKIQPANIGRVGLACFMVLMTILCGFETIARNRNWKDDYTLFTHDINVVPNSFLVNVNVASTLVNRSESAPDEKTRIADLRRGISLFSKAIAMQDNYVLGYMNRGVAYLKLDVPDSVMLNIDKVRALYPIHPMLPEMYFYTGQAFYAHKEPDKAYNAMQLSLQLRPDFMPARNAIRYWDSIKTVQH